MKRNTENLLNKIPLNNVGLMNLLSDYYSVRNTPLR